MKRVSTQWIFLRGLTRGNIHWGNFPEIFKRLNPEAQMLFLEIPGNGNYVSMQTPTNPKDVVDFLRTMNTFPPPFHLCGISLGGMVALKWAELYPEEIASVTVINSSLSQYSSFAERLLPSNYLSMLKALFVKDILTQEKMILAMTSNKPCTSREFSKRFANFAESHKVTKKNFLKQLILAKNINIKTLPEASLMVLSSKLDRLVSARCSMEIAKGLDGKLYVHPTAGHDLPLDEPEWLAEHLKTF